MIGGWVPEDDDDPHHLGAPVPAVADVPAAAHSDTQDDEDDPAASGVRRVRRVGGRGRGRLAQRWVPESLRDSRIDPGKRGALLLTLVAAVAALVAAVGVWRDRPEPRPVQAVSLAQASSVAAARPSPPTGPSGRRSSTSGPTADGAAPGDTTTATGVIVVSVTGAVRKPGLVRLAAGARVAEAIEKAGGTTTSADLTGLNLAAKLTDGASVVVADADDPAAGGSSGSFLGDTGGSTSGTAGAPAGKVDLNTADVAALDALPGVGPVTAASIVAWREKNGRFTSVEQLQEIQGIGPAKYAALAKLVTV